MGSSVERVSLAAGNPEGENSAYVLSDRNAVVDPGPPTEDAWERLRAGIEETGLGVGDVEYVFVTHWHVDHAGLVPQLVDATEATVVMHERDAPLVADYAAERAERVDRDARRLRQWGVPADVVEAVQSGDRPSPMPDSLADDRVASVTDGETVAGVEAVHTPGHTLGHAAFVVDEAGEADRTGESGVTTGTPFVGDLVLPTYTPNVGGGDTRLENALATYLESLRRVRSVCDRRGVEAVAPGHGSPLAFGERVDEIVTHHDERSRRTVAVLDAVDDESGSADAERARSDAGATPWQVATRLFGEMEGIHAKMGAGEAASHLEFLRERDAVERVPVGADGVDSAGSADDADGPTSGPRRYRVVDAGRAGVDGVESG
ncbi:Glyoxylase, beta-lactamase superfamily II [Halogranum amylolyticum]|uniref:Glyoxylase, beta-lactamase superfamily II n=1 Tax=Halogranum amylolyticum TaxID=660520 RepID=A0A1H8TDQ6_9EURY|nr:Glyoxylase, beta-lactamase superfamily II [Halogranum amylolyticum]